MYNTIIIAIIIIAVIAVGVYYYRVLKKEDTDLEYNSQYSIKHLTDLVSETFASIQKTNLKEQNLSKKELEQEQRKKLKVKAHLKTAAYGDTGAKLYIKESIKEILTNPALGNITPDIINEVMAFNDPESLTNREKADIIFYIFFKEHGNQGFNALMQKYHIHWRKDITPEEEECGALSHEFTTADLNCVFDDIYPTLNLTYDEKLDIITERIFADYKGFGPIDTLFDFAIDEIDCGVNGIMKGEYDLKTDDVKDLEYSFKSIYVVYKGINLKLSFLSFADEKELIRICQNIYKFSTPYALSRRKGYVVGTMKDGSRISVSRPPIANSWCFFARKFDSVPAGNIEDLIKDNNAFIPMTVLKWQARTCRTNMITGMMGTGKTTMLKALIRFLPSQKNLRVYEISPELNLQFTYPRRNIVNFSVTESTTMEDLYTFGKKCNAQVNIVGESASAEMGVIFVESATVGSEMAMGTHHAKTAADLILALRDNLTTAGGYSSEKVAEEVVAKCVNFNTHLKREGEHRFIERITEIIPIRDRSYPCEKNGNFSDEDTKEYYKRMTDRQTFETKNIVEFDRERNEYRMVNEISPEMMEEMLDYISDRREKAEFIHDMEMLNALVER